MIKTIKRKLKTFFDTLTKSLTNFSYYKDIEKADFKFSLKYLFSLFYLISLITSIVFAVSASIFLLPNLPKFVSLIEMKANSFYPDALVVNVKNGNISTNQKEPYYIDSLNSLSLNKGFDHFLTIDTNAAPANIKDEKTFILVTKDSVVTEDNNNSYSVYPIDTKTNTKIDKSGYVKAVSRILPYLKYIEPAVIILIILLVLVWPFIGAALSLVGELVYLLIFSAIFFIVVKLLKKKLTFKKLYQLAMHAATLPIILGLVVASVGIQMPFLLGSAILFVFMILVINHLS